MTPNSSTDSATRDGPRLLACPFCEGSATEDYESDADYPSKGFMFIRCCRCGVKTSAIYGSRDPSEWADARHNWNRRADTLLAASRAEVERLRAEVPRWISPQDEMPPPLTTVPTLSKEKRSTTGWAHSYGCWNDDPDDNSRPDSKMFKAQTAYWCRLPMLPENPSNRSTTPKG